ncbi:bacteriohemerythrin [Azospirillum halopraeferens]|uniref:bacteriohemerythrin n=1 Tax=Azospirillum halopraeferens TaxID=34010 RepID=UPI000411B040|nr:bacteriohemerythrin [Azospirillum halopraeferens]
MDYVAWEQRMSVGVDVLDGDHKRLLAMFNGLLAGGVSARAKDDVSGLLGDLRDYTDVHFRREEEWMERAGYPDLESHRAAHRHFVAEVEKLRREFDDSHAVMLRIDLILLLKDWLIDHIQTVDMRYKPFLAGSDVAASGAAPTG